MSDPRLSHFAPSLAEKIETHLAGFDRDLAETIRARLHVLVQLGVRSADEAARLLNEDASPEDWSAAYVLIAADGNPRLGQPIADALKKAASPELRQSLIQALGAVKGDAAREALIDVLRNDPNPGLRVTAALQLSTFWGDFRVGEALTTLLGDLDEDEDVRAEAAHSLASMRGVPAVEERLLEALEDESSRVRYCAAESLASVGTGRAVAPLRAMAEREGDSVTKEGALREAALFAISNIHARQGNSVE